MNIIWNIKTGIQHGQLSCVESRAKPHVHATRIRITNMAANGIAHQITGRSEIFTVKA